MYPPYNYAVRKGSRILRCRGLQGEDGPRMGKSTKLVWLALAAIMGAFYPISASAEELVTFASAPYRLGRLQERLARERGETSKTSEAIEGYLSKPEGRGPFPAIVYLHGCGGLSKIRGNVLLTSLPVGPTYHLPLIASRPAGSKKPVQLKCQTARLTPWARYPTSRSFPSLILNGLWWSEHRGELDDWSLAADCQRFMKRRAGRGAPVDLIVYPGAYHDFDVPAFVDGKKMFGHWLKYDADAAVSSVQAMHNFLSAQLSH